MTFLILCKKHLGNVSFYILDYPSNMVKKLLLAELIIREDKKYRTIFVGTSHFESIDINHDFRSKQLKLAFDVLDRINDSFLIGDFNFDPELHYSERKNNPDE